MVVVPQWVRVHTYCISQCNLVYKPHEQHGTCWVWTYHISTGLTWLLLGSLTPPLTWKRFNAVLSCSSSCWNSALLTTLSPISTCGTFAVKPAAQRGRWAFWMLIVKDIRCLICCLPSLFGAGVWSYFSGLPPYGYLGQKIALWFWDLHRTHLPVECRLWKFLLKSIMLAVIRSIVLPSLTCRVCLILIGQICRCWWCQLAQRSMAGSFVFHFWLMSS